MVSVHGSRRTADRQRVDGNTARPLLGGKRNSKGGVRAGQSRGEEEGTGRHTAVAFWAAANTGVREDEAEDTPSKEEERVKEEKEPLYDKDTVSGFEGNPMKVSSDGSDCECNQGVGNRDHSKKGTSFRYGSQQHQMRDCPLLPTATDCGRVGNKGGA
ncbi:hypothetical protein Cgig2_028138 [Carnegiea gigantea]|uniref:Uncharacterized protein n=1 Tax=Carnegiea gigantea TaxID=171969 RepID=A0A9Q1JZP7_9CARY|nr:hypothetical protein Cgig2_028138 [Carnegiea gigantea]